MFKQGNLVEMYKTGIYRGKMQNSRRKKKIELIGVRIFRSPVSPNVSDQILVGEEMRPKQPQYYNEIQDGMELLRNSWEQL